MIADRWYYARRNAAVRLARAHACKDRYAIPRYVRVIDRLEAVAPADVVALKRRAMVALASLPETYVRESTGA